MNRLNFPIFAFWFSVLLAVTSAASIPRHISDLVHPPVMSAAESRDRHFPIISALARMTLSSNVQAGIHNLAQKISSSHQLILKKVSDEPAKTQISISRKAMSKKVATEIDVTSGMGIYTECSLCGVAKAKNSIMQLVDDCFPCLSGESCPSSCCAKPLDPTETQFLLCEVEGW